MYHVKGGSEDGAPADDLLISPDGKWALALVSTQLYVVAVPVMGGPPPTVNVFTPNVPTKKLTDIGTDYFAWAVGASFFRQPISSVSFEPEKKDEDNKGGDQKDTAKKDEKKPPQWEEIPVTIQVPRHKPSGTVVLRGARAITMRYVRGVTTSSNSSGLGTRM